MTQISRPWNGTAVGDAGPYSDSEWWEIYRYLAGPYDSGAGLLAGSGVAPDIGLQVTQQSPLARGVLVAPGAAMVDGTFYNNDSSVALSTAPNASGLTRIDTVILRKDIAAQTIRLAVLQGTPAASPVPATLTQNASTWEIGLADITLANGYASVTNSVIFRRQNVANGPEGIYLYGLQNKTGQVLPPGTMLYFNPTMAADRGVYFFAAQDKRYVFAGVTVDWVPIDGYCRLLSRGICQIRTTGAVARGRSVIPDSVTSGVGSQASTAAYFDYRTIGFALAASSGNSTLCYIDSHRPRTPYAASVLRNNGANYTTTATSFASNFMVGVGVVGAPGSGVLSGNAQIDVAFSGVGEHGAGNFIYFDVLDANGNAISGFTNGLTLIRGLGAGVPVPFHFSGVIPVPVIYDISALNLGWRVNAGTGTVYSTAVYPVHFSYKEVA